jgi:hypothetical protein
MAILKLVWHGLAGILESKLTLLVHNISKLLCKGSHSLPYLHSQNEAHCHTIPPPLLHDIGIVTIILIILNIAVKAAVIIAIFLASCNSYCNNNLLLSKANAYPTTKTKMSTNFCFCNTPSF